MILILTLGRIFEIPGGVVNFTNSLGKWITKQNYDVTIMGTGFASVQSKQLSKKELVHEKKNKKKKPRILNPPYIIWMLSRFYLSLIWILKILLINSKTPIKLIHAQDTGYAGLVAVLSGKVLRIPVILSSHGIRHKSLESILKRKFNKLLLKIEYRLDIFTINNANCIIVLNPSDKNYFKKLTKKEIEYIPIPINVKNFKFSETNRDLIRKEFEIEKTSKVIGYVGRLSPEKNLLTLLNAFSQALEKNSLKLMLVGTGTNESVLRKFVVEKNIQNKVFFCGFRNDISKILSAFDVFVLPSYTEGLPTVLLEAMASGRAVLCSNIPAHQNLIEQNKEGLLFDPYNPEDLKNHIQLLCNDDLLRENLGKNASIKALQYDAEIVFPKILVNYRKFLDKPSMEDFGKSQ